MAEGVRFLNSISGAAAGRSARLRMPRLRPYRPVPACLPTRARAWLLTGAPGCTNAPAAGWANVVAVGWNYFRAFTD